MTFLLGRILTHSKIVLTEKLKKKNSDNIQIIKILPLQRLDLLGILSI